MESSNIATQNRGKEMTLLGLFGTKEFEKFQKRLAEATDFSFSIIDYKGAEVIPGYYQKYYKHYLNKVGEDSDDRISSAFAAAKAAITNMPYIYLCRCGLVRVALPIIVKEQYLGAIICGNVFCNDMKYIDPETKKPLINMDIPYVESEDNMKEFKDFPVFSAKRIKINTDLIFYVLQELCQKEDYLLKIDSDEHNQIHLRDMRQKNRELKEKIQRLEVEKLKLNLYPQTLLDMLVTISNSAIVEDATVTQSVVEIYSDILRYYVENERNHITLEKELKQIEQYYNILKLQYEDLVNVEISYPKEVKTQLIPKLSVFPLARYLSEMGKRNSSEIMSYHISVEFINSRCIITFRSYNDGDQSVLSENGTSDVNDIKEQIEKLKKRFTMEYPEDYRFTFRKDYILLDIPQTNTR